MTKRTVGEDIWLVEQPDHARIAGFLAAHWGNDSFTRPGYFEDPPDPEFWRNQVIFAIAEHDNGWLEWEANPQIDPADGLPLDFLHISQDQGFDNWRAGIARYQETHPLPALLISWHSRLLQLPFAGDHSEPHLLHPFFQNRHRTIDAAGQEPARAFIVEQQQFASALLDRASAEAAVKTAIDEGVRNPPLSFPNGGIPATLPVRTDSFLMPHVRLLQIADALSLMLCFGGHGLSSIPETPRRAWDDRVSIELSPAKGRRIAVHPYPFDSDPLAVHLPVRILRKGLPPNPSVLTLDKEVIDFEFAAQPN